MREIVYLKVILFVLFLAFSNCNNLNFAEENTEAVRLRISKISCNKNMENAKTFEYNSEGFLIKLAPEFLNSSLYYIYEIQYDVDNKPIQVKESMFLSGNTTVSVTKIEWTDYGFDLIYNDNNKDKLRLNAKNQIIGKNDNKVFTWFQSDSLLVNDNSSENLEKYKFVNYNHPLSGINIAIIHAAEILMCEWIEWQNKYCVSEWVKRDDCSGKFFYSVNEQNYPTAMRKRFESCFGTSYGTLYFEYETY